MIHDPRGGTPVRTNIKGQPYMFFVEFDTNNTSAPDGVNPTQGITVARAGVGDFTITFDEEYKPRVVHCGWVCIEADNAELHGKVTGYTDSTGVVTLTIYDDSAVAGTEAPADTTDIRVQVLLLCNSSELGDD